MKTTLLEELSQIKKIMGVSPKSINIPHHEHLIETFSDDYNEISEEDDFDEKQIVIDKIKNNDFTNNPKSFLKSIRKSERLEMLTDYDIKDLSDMKLFKLNGYDIGYALKKFKDGSYSEIVSVFNNSGIKGIGDYLIESAISNGGCYLDHYDGFLSTFYSKHGFEEYDRDIFDSQYDPTGEFRKKYGESDIIYRKHKDC